MNTSLLDRPAPGSADTSDLTGRFAAATSAPGIAASGIAGGGSPTVRWQPPDAVTRQRAPRSRRTTLLVLAATGAAVGSIFIGNTAVGAIAALFVISWPLERLWRRHPIGVRRVGLRTDLAYAVAQPLLQFLGLVVAVIIGFASLAWLPGLALRPVVTNLPMVVQIVGGILLFDALTYWTHRWSHTVPLFWRFHAIHHSTTHLDWVSGFRGHPFDGAFAAPVFAFFLAAGFDYRVTGGLAIVQFVIGIWSHLNVRWRLRPLQKVILTPDFHHWHHAYDVDARNSNFSVFLPVWDLVFGTYHMPADRRPMRYGISQPTPPGIVAQLMHPLLRPWRRPR